MPSIEDLAEQSNAKMRSTVFNVLGRESKGVLYAVLVIAFHGAEDLVKAIEKHNANRKKINEAIKSKQGVVFTDEEEFKKILKEFDVNGNGRIEGDEIKEVEKFAVKHGLQLLVTANVDPKTKETMYYAQFAGKDEATINAALDKIDEIQTAKLAKLGTKESFAKVQKSFEKMLKTNGINAEITVHDRGHNRMPEFVVKAGNKEDLEKVQKIVMESSEMKKLTKIFEVKPDIYFIQTDIEPPAIFRKKLKEIIEKDAILNPDSKGENSETKKALVQISFEKHATGDGQVTYDIHLIGKQDKIDRAKELIRNSKEFAEIKGMMFNEDKRDDLAKRVRFQETATDRER
jgi:Ca2+-binding EF-hand superfamily protein